MAKFQKDPVTGFEKKNSGKTNEQIWVNPMSMDPKTMTATFKYLHLYKPALSIKLNGLYDPQGLVKFNKMKQSTLYKKQVQIFK